MTKQQKLNVLFIAFLLIAIIIGIIVVRQRQEIRKKAAIETPLQLILNPQTANLTPGQLINPIVKIDNTSGSQYPISGVEAIIAIGNQIGILTAGSDCLAPFNGLKSITLNENTNTVTILCAVAADQAPYIIQGLEKKDAIRLSLVGKTTPLGQAQLTFTTTRITQAGAAGSMQAINLSSGGLTGDYTVANPTPSTTANQPPTCVGGIAIPNVPFVNNKFNITKGTTVTLNAYGIGDPDGNNTVQIVIFRHKKTGLPASEQCPNSTDGSLIGQGQSGVDDSGVPIWTINFNTTNVAEGEYYIWANPSDGQMQCSGNPYGTSLNNYCTVGVGCKNCQAIAIIQVTGTTPTSAPTPTQPIGGLTGTPPAGGSIGVSFNVRIPDISQSVTQIAPQNFELEVYDGNQLVTSLNPQIALNRNGQYFTVTLPINVSTEKLYTVMVKPINGIRRRFNNVRLKPNIFLDCLSSANAVSCGELTSQIDNKLLLSGDSDKFNRQSGSFNKVDVNDYNNYLRERFGGVNNLLTDFNGDGLVNVSDLAIWAKNYNVNGDSTP